jgi:hypothetical protein
MANFDTSNLVTAQTIIDDKYAQHEMRSKLYPALRLLLGNSPFIQGDTNTLRTREDRPIETHMLARTRRNSGTARAHNHTGTFDDSAKVSLSWAIKSDVTSISLKLLDRSLFDFNTILANKMEQCMLNVIEDLETAAIAYLEAQKTQYCASLAANIANYNSTNDAVEISAANKARFYQLLKSVMRTNNYRSNLDIIADSQLYVDAEFYGAQGGGNATNTAFQFLGMNIAESTEMSDANYTNGFVYAMPQGAACTLTWIPQQNRAGWGDYNSYVGGYGMMSDPFGLGIDFAVHGYAQRSDTSSSNGATQDVTMEFEVSVDYSNNKAPLTQNSNETPIFKVGLTA